MRDRTQRSETLRKQFWDKHTDALSEISLENISALIYAFLGLTVYEEQLKAGALMHRGEIVEQKTGEGKTISILIAALMGVREGRKIYIITSNDYLSNRDYSYSKELFDFLGIKSVHLKESVGGEISAYEENDVIYATGETLIFDYLRGIRPDYDTVIIDEIDYILVDCAGHDFSVSDGKSLITLPDGLLRIARYIATSMLTVKKTSGVKKETVFFDYEYEYDAVLDYAARAVKITSRGYEYIGSIVPEGEHSFMLLEAVTAALQAEYFFIAGVDYIIRDSKIILINGGNGRIAPNSETDIFVQSEIELKEGLELSEKSLLHSACSFPVFFSVFHRLSGISGTASLVPYDFGALYGRAVVKVKEHRKNRRKEIYRYFEKKGEKESFLFELLREDGRFLLILKDDKKAAEMFSMIEKRCGKTVLLLDNTHIESEEEYLKRLSAEDIVLISTKILSRGTDIAIPETAEDGLKVILYERLESRRTERQVIGRTGRNGNRGTAYILASGEDPVFIYEYKKESRINERHISALQARYEQAAFERRKHIYIRSKLFFDQDEAIRNRLNDFKSYEDILEYIDRARGKKHNDGRGRLKGEIAGEAKRKIAPRSGRRKKEAERGLDKISAELSYRIKNRCDYHSGCRALLIYEYEKIRPFFQAQFLRYNDLQAAELYTDEGFNRRGKEYIAQGGLIIEEVIYKMLFG